MPSTVDLAEIFRVDAKVRRKNGKMVPPIDPGPGNSIQVSTTWLAWMLNYLDDGEED